VLAFSKRAKYILDIYSDENPTSSFLLLACVTLHLLLLMVMAATATAAASVVQLFGAGHWRRLGVANFRLAGRVG
jgi:hypothetical protein